MIAESEAELLSKANQSHQVERAKNISKRKNQRKPVAACRRHSSCETLKFEENIRISAECLVLDHLLKAVQEDSCWARQGRHCDDDDDNDDGGFERKAEQAHTAG